MRKLHLFHAIALLIIFAAAVACTSSSTTTRTNPSYDQDYSRSTRSRTSSQASSSEGFPEETYRPPVTLMMVSMTTGEVIEGESYPVIAVVDNPENRDLTYRWSVEDGELGELPESMRGDVLGFEEQLRSNRGISGQAPTGEGVAEEGASAPGAEGMVGPPTGESAASKPAGPRAGEEEARSKPAPRPKPPVESEPSAEEETEPETEESETTEESEQPAEESEEETPAQAAPTEETDEEEPENGKSQLVAMNIVRYAALGPEEDKGDENEPAEEDWPEPQPKETDEGAAAEELPEQVEETDDEATEDTDEETAEEQLSEEELAAREAISDEDEAEGMVEEVGESAEEFEGFTPTVGEGRLVEPKVEEEEAEEEESLLDAAPSLVTTETDKPYALWTPPGTGSYTLRCIVLDDKGNELTPERSFPVTVTKPEPKTELVWNTSQKLYEDDYLVVEVRVKNVPSFGKGLFTLKFNPAELSFRLVETGDFFPSDYRTSLFFAQPPNDPGKVTVAISADEVGLPKGDGVVARTIFKVKETIGDPSQLNISEVMNEEARYVLDAEGINVLPLVTEHPIYATEWTEPPERPQQSRSQAASKQRTEGVPSTPQPPGGVPTPSGTSGAQGSADRGMAEGMMPPDRTGRLGGGGGASRPGTDQGIPTEGMRPPPEEISPPEEESGEMGLDAQLQELQQRRLSIEEDPDLTEEERESALALIDQQIQALLEGGGPVGVVGAGI